MIIENGTIQPKIKIGGGIDEQGNKILPAEYWGNEIPCNIRVNNSNLKGAVNGNTFTEATYEILIHPQPFDWEVVKIKLHGRDIGEYPLIKKPEFLYAVEALKITV